MSEPAAYERTVGDYLMRVAKLLTAVRHRQPRVHPQVDPMTYPLLFTLWVQPRRLRDLADALHVDPSTVSRQVSTLVGLGLIDRGPDPDDGRAQRLGVTPEGAELLTQLRTHRDAWLEQVLTDWQPDDIERFSAYLARFGADLEAHTSMSECRATSTPADPEPADGLSRTPVDYDPADPDAVARTDGARP